MNRRSKFTLSIAIGLAGLALVAGSAMRQVAPVRQEAGDPQLDAAVERALRRHNVPGASVSVVRNGEPSWAKGYGLADPANGVPAAPDTVYEAASVAKSVTAWGIMTLVEAGRIDLDAPIARYVTRWQLPPSEYDPDQVTVRRVLSHTAGLSTDGDPGVDPGEYVATLEEALDGAVFGMRALHIATPPGEDYHYSSVGYTLLELAVEEVSGESFASYMQRQVLDPLGMVNSSYNWTPELLAKAAVGHDWYNNPLPHYQYSTRAQGSLRTTAADLAIFVAASMPGPNGEPVGRGVLTPESVAEILTPVPFAKEAESGHISGLGVDLMMADGSLLGARKTGDHRGFKPIIVMAPAQGEGIAIMANGDRAAIGFLMDIACPWSEGVDGDPMAEGCRQLRMFRNIELGVGWLLGLGALAYLGLIVAGVQAGRRRWGWSFTWGKAFRIALPALLLVLWWVVWYTDTLITDILRIFPNTGVPVRFFVPWPTAFVWVSWGITLWSLAWIVVVLAPKAKMDTTRSDGPRPRG